MAYFFAAAVIAIPIIAVNVLLDSLYFDPSLKTWTLTGYNFLQANIVEGVSKYFGEDEWHWYLTNALAQLFVELYPLALLAPFYHILASKKSKQWPYMSMYVIFYILVFSLIPHKEARFLLPALPFMLLMIAQFMTECIVPKMSSFLVRKIIFLGIVIEAMVYLFLTLNHRTNHQIHEWL